MRSLPYLLLMQRDGCSCFSQVIEFKLKIPEISLVKATEYCIFDYLDFEKMCKDRDRLISLLNAKFENFSDYSKMQMVYGVIMVRNKKCNLFSLKLFIILTELDSVPLMKSFLQHSPEYTCVIKEFRFSKENLIKLKKELTREYNTFQIQNGMIVYECKVLFLDDLFYLWESEGKYLLFNQVGNLCVDATSYFEFIYKVSIMILDSKRN